MRRAVAIAMLLVAGCTPDGATISMSFARASFYDAPFPSDDLRRTDGTIDLSKVPNPTHVDLMTQALTLLQRDARGFALAGGIFFRASRPLDPTSLPDVAGSITDGASVFLVGVDAPAGSSRRLPVDVAFVEDGGPFGDRDLLALLPVQGIPLRPKSRYAAVVTRSVRDAAHARLGRSAEMSALAAGRRPPGLDDATFGEYRDALQALSSLVPTDEIAALAVFTTDDPAAALARVRDDALATHPIAPPSTVTLANVYPDYCEYTTTVQVPDYQSGTPPYSRTGGDWLFDAGGKPMFDHFEPAHLYFTVPRASMPAGGWPTVVFVRTGGGGDVPLAERGLCATPEFTQPITPGTGPAREFARVGWAGVQLDGPIGGLRNTTNGDEDLLLFNVFNAAALRDNIRESAMELSLLARALPGFTVDTHDCPGANASVRFDGANLAIMGHSIGAWLAPLAFAWEPSLRAAVLSGAGGSYIANVLDKQKPLLVRPFVEILLGYQQDQRTLTAHDPALTLVQWAAEPSDPQVYTHLYTTEPPTPRHVLMLQGIVDHYILPSIANSISLSLGLDEAGPSYDATNAEEEKLGQVALEARLPLVGRAQISLPATGNAMVNGAPVTAVVVQHPGDAVEDGHEVVFQTEPPKHQYRCFLASLLRGVPTVPPDDAADARCP